MPVTLILRDMNNLWGKAQNTSNSRTDKLTYEWSHYYLKLIKTVLNKYMKTLLIIIGFLRKNSQSIDFLNLNFIAYKFKNLCEESHSKKKSRLFFHFQEYSMWNLMFSQRKSYEVLFDKWGSRMDKMPIDKSRRIHKGCTYSNKECYLQNFEDSLHL